MTAEAPSPVPSSREFTFLGVTYGLYTIGLVMLWPAFIGLTIAYVKRSDVGGSFLESHYGWLIRTFWWWAAGFVLALGALLAMVLPGAIESGRAIEASHMAVLPWSVLGGAAAGGVAILVVWCWVVYRLIRGALRLADGRAVP